MSKLLDIYYFQACERETVIYNSQENSVPMETSGTHSSSYC